MVEWLMFYTYLLKLSNNKYYVGHSDNLKERMKYHGSGKVNSTAVFRPHRLIFFAAFPKKILAIKFENYLKSSPGNAFRNKRLL
jgi:putative endonuclease